jgi:hypothetical protein
MSNGDKGEQERADTERSQVGMMRLFGQMLLLPFTVFVFGIELFAKTIRELQRTADEGMDLLAGDAGLPCEGASAAEGQSTASVGGEAPAAPTVAKGSWGDLKSQTIAVTDDGIVRDAAEVNDKETVMRDKDLNDDQLKLVRYKILFVKRDYETAFPEREELVPDNLTGEGYAAWKVAEFIQRLTERRTYIPSDWKKGDKPKYPEEDKYTENTKDGWVLLGLPEKDKKYLRVYFEVLERYVREEDEDTEVDVLREIRDAIKGIPPGTSAYGSVASGSGSSGTGSSGSSGGTSAGPGGGGPGSGGSVGGGRGYSS